MLKDVNIYVLRQIVLSVCIVVAIYACSSDDEGSNNNITPPTPSISTEKIQIHISSKPETRATDNAFEIGDKIGIFVVSHNTDGTATTLKTRGNYIDNCMFSLQDSWTSAIPQYWKDNSTHADFYMYYPYTSEIANVETFPWSIKEDQSSEANYKASELLIGKTLDVAPSEDDVNISAKHVMAQVVITLIANKGFTSTDLANTDINVSINNVKTQAIANLATGIVTAIGNNTNVIPHKEGDIYKALIVPQKLNSGNIITVTVNDMMFYLSKTSQLSSLEAGHSYQFTVTLSKTSSGMNADIVKWKDDGNDYGGIAEQE